MSVLPFRLDSKAICVPVRDHEGSVSTPRENVICRWSLPSGRIVNTSGSPEAPVLYAIPPQMLAHDLARLKRLDPDATRGLSKVTETW